MLTQGGFVASALRELSVGLYQGNASMYLAGLKCWPGAVGACSYVWRNRAFCCCWSLTGSVRSGLLAVSLPASECCASMPPVYVIERAESAVYSLRDVGCQQL